ncbi:MarR family winged helix-turn-helix transcriptional regulator [Haliangium ochraceum]|uniref:Transcriptional regulator, MarR family n=1 Tax=Haliangium ochraceum (strain DSM 14365 / JCM 11303 / SMP-2) TaxID=502025 RepID=D0LHD6_HALO1|nr:MarR family winged helix-turn-helix transcriptional regulator [Haliangium ochraceum]ACY18281.1 transcriptional regulator, MarR family [Haliangium ochraceum DSM 14365]
MPSKKPTSTTYADRGDVPMARLCAMAYRSLVDELHERLEARGYRGLKRSYGFVLLPARERTKTVSDVASEIGFTKQAASKLVESMRAAGYVELVANPADARSKLLRLTAAGERLLAQVEDIYRELEAEWAEVLGKRRLDALRGDLERILRARNEGALPGIRPGW